MATHKSELPKATVDGYWKAVREHLRKNHRLSLADAKRGVESYRRAIEKKAIGDLIYHAPIEETACGIIAGGYSKP